VDYWWEGNGRSKGPILGMTIMLEVGDIRRFPKVGNYSSYCRCVESKRISNKKKKGENNKKNGNRYLAWAYVEAANHTIRICSKAQRFFQRKMPCEWRSKCETGGSRSTFVIFWFTEVPRGQSRPFMCPPKVSRTLGQKNSS